MALPKVIHFVVSTQANGCKTMRGFHQSHPARRISYSNGHSMESSKFSEANGHAQ